MALSVRWKIQSSPHRSVFLPDVVSAQIETAYHNYTTSRGSSQSQTPPPFVITHDLESYIIHFQSMQVSKNGRTLSLFRRASTLSHPATQSSDNYFPQLLTPLPITWHIETNAKNMTALAPDVAQTLELAFRRLLQQSRFQQQQLPGFDLLHGAALNSRLTQPEIIVNGQQYICNLTEMLATPLRARHEAISPSLPNASTDSHEGAGAGITPHITSSTSSSSSASGDLPTYRLRRSPQTKSTKGFRSMRFTQIMFAPSAATMTNPAAHYISVRLPSISQHELELGLLINSKLPWCIPFPTFTLNTDEFHIAPMTSNTDHLDYTISSDTLPPTQNTCAICMCEFFQTDDDLDEESTTKAFSRLSTFGERFLSSTLRSSGTLGRSKVNNNANQTLKRKASLAPSMISSVIPENSITQQHHHEPSTIDEVAASTLSVVKLPCGHLFHPQCFAQYHEAICPMCRVPYKLAQGSQPPGVMTVRYDSSPLPDSVYQSFGTIFCRFDLESIILENGAIVPSDHRVHCMPASAQGFIALRWLATAWLQRLVFRIGYSQSRNQDNVVTYQLTIKSEIQGGHGWPDNGYWQRLYDDCKTAGVSTSILQQYNTAYDTLPIDQVAHIGQ